MNRLSHSTSPYLRQHAHNPVDWYEWTPEALELAKREDKPILLSIGYAACHWCHVMAHESFEDPNIAAVMNRLYVNIKLDREQRPDLDRVYQLSHQLLTQRGGGWPLTVFLDPSDRTAYFAGTYFPKEARYGLPGFGQVLEGVAQWYRSERAELRAQNARMHQALSGIFSSTEERSAGRATLRDLDTALRAWLQNADRDYGGIGRGQKFPHPMEWRLVDALATRAPTGVEVPAELIDALRLTLGALAQGGLHDHLGGGFFRYCVDRQWEIPHFEKMLYDNALLLPLFASAHQRWPADGFDRCAEGIVDFVLRELRAPVGRGLQASLDADSEGHEGQFYIWQRTAVEALLPEADRTLAVAAYALDGARNFEDQAWHLTRRRALSDIAAAAGVDPAIAETRLEAIRATLLAARATRVRPETNDQWLLGWNALFVGGLVRAAQSLGHADWLALASSLYGELRTGLRRADGTWIAHRGAAESVVRDDAQPAFLDDLAWLLEAQLDLLAAGAGGPALLADAVAVAERLATQHAAADGGFWFSAEEVATRADSPPVRPRGFTDEATPNGNGIATRALLRLGRLTAEPRWLKLADAVLQAAAGGLRRQPDAMASLLAALLEAEAAAVELVWRGPASAWPAWQSSLRSAAARGMAVWHLPDADAEWPGALASQSGGPFGRVYWCRHGACEMPLDTPAALQQRLQSERA